MHHNFQQANKSIRKRAQASASKHVRAKQSQALPDKNTIKQIDHIKDTRFKVWTVMRNIENLWKSTTIKHPAKRFNFNNLRKKRNKNSRIYMYFINYRAKCSRRLLLSV